MPAPSSDAAGSRTGVTRVLFLCTANSARSQIAEALLAQRGGDRFVVASAGTAPAASVHPGAVAALAHLGIDWSGARPKGLTAVGGVDWDLVITTCDQLREGCPQFPGHAIYAHWGVPDPAYSDRGGAAFSDTAALLTWRIDMLLSLRSGSLRPDAADREGVTERLTVIGRSRPHAPAAPAAPRPP